MGIYAVDENYGIDFETVYLYIHYIMKALQSISLFILTFVVMTSFSQCSSSKSLEQNPPFNVGSVYSETWTAGVEGGGSGYNIFIPVENHSVQLDSVYYKGRSAKLETKPSNESLYIGRFLNENNSPQDIILSNDPKEEAKNKLPKVPENIPFELKDDECVITYLKEGKVHYVKISNVESKSSAPYPSAPPNRQ